MDNNIFKSILEEFILDCKIKGLSENTIITYSKVWTKFIKDMELNKHTNLNYINTLLIKQYTIKLQESNLSPATINNYLRHIKVIINWMLENEYLKTPIKITMVKVNVEVKEVFTSIEVARLTSKPINTNKFVDYRNWLIANVLTETGMRGATLLNIKWTDVDFKLRTININKSKTGKGRVIPISDTLYKVLLQYTRMFDTLEYVINTPSGNQLSIHTLRTTMNIYHKSKGVKTGLHQYRRTFITRCISKGIDSILIARMVGNSVEMINRHYFSNNVEYLRNVVK